MAWRLRIKSYTGDKITLIGDYDESKLYDIADKKYQNISKLLYKEYNDAVKKDGFHKEMGL